MFPWVDYLDLVGALLLFADVVVVSLYWFLWTFGCCLLVVCGFICVGLGNYLCLWLLSGL